jgi:hypothetical protein
VRFVGLQKYGILSANEIAIFCSLPIVLYFLKCITENIELTKGRKYLTQKPHVGQPCFKL